MLVSTIHEVSLLSLKNYIHTELPESIVILSNIIDRSDTGIVRLKILNFNKHLNSLKMEWILLTIVIFDQST